MPKSSKTDHLLNAIWVRVRAGPKTRKARARAVPILDHSDMDLKVGLIGHAICGLGAGLVRGALNRYTYPRSTHHGRPGH